MTEEGAAPVGDAGGAPATIPQPAAPATGDAPGAAADGAPGGADAPADGGTPPPVAAKHKIRRNGQDSEHSLDEILGMVGDDHQHTLTVNGKDRNVNYPELVRMAQLGDAGYTNMQQAAKMRRDLDQQRKTGAEDIPAYLTEHLGVEDYDTWVMEQAEDIVMLEKLAKEDPFKFRIMSKERDATQAKARRAREDSANEAKDRQANEDRYWQNLAQQAPEALKRVGLTDSKEIRGRVAKVIKKHRAVGYNMPIADAVATVAADHKSSILSHLTTLGPEVLDYVGDDMRKIFRDEEVKRLRASESAAEKKTNEGGGQAPAVAGIKPPAAGKKPTMLRDVRRG